MANVTVGSHTKYNGYVRLLHNGRHLVSILAEHDNGIMQDRMIYVNTGQRPGVYFTPHELRDILSRAIKAKRAEIEAKP